MQNIDKFYIDGAWVSPESTTTMPIMNPSTNSQIGSLTLGNINDVNKAVAAARRAFESYSQSSKAERLALLNALLEQTHAHQEELAQAISAEMGAPITLSRNEQARCAIGHLKAFIQDLEALNEETTLSNGDLIWREPIGVCGLITPWNWPINQIALKVIPALAVGATVVLKPSEHTPLSAQIYAKIIDKAGFPKGVFNLVHGDGETVGRGLSAHEDIAMMSFTGSTRAGRLVSIDAAQTIKRVALELGGKSPNLVFADADLETLVPASVFNCFSNSGQSCNAPTRMLVERSCYDKVIALAKQAGQAQQVNMADIEGKHIGPLFDKIQYDRVQTLIQSGIDQGATLLCGGLGKPEGFEAGWFVKPTIFTDVHDDMRIVREEIFGPVMVIIPFDSEEEAIRIANDTEYGLAAYIQSGDAQRIRRVAKQLRAGTIQINAVGPDYGSPFGGYKQSGNGREGGRFGLDDYLEIKALPAFEK